MKTLIAIQPAYGEFHPLVPLARALVEAGHEVLFACARSFCPIVEATGFRTAPLGLDWSASKPEQTFPAWQTMTPDEQRRFWVGHICPVATAPPMAADILSLATTWKPDVIIRDYYEFGSYIAAECLQVPHVVAGIGLGVPLDGLRGLAGAPLNELRAWYGLPADPALETLFRHLYLHYLPPTFAPVSAFLPHAYAIRPPVFDQSGDERAPDWLPALPDRPTVYATLGTVFNYSRPVFDAILADLWDEPINLIVTVGRDQDPALFGPQPPHVRIERYIPQSLLLPYCALIITHGGFNTTVAALTFGVPQLYIPISADQPFNAERCVEIGTGMLLQPDDLEAGRVREAVNHILNDPRYRTAAQRLRDEIGAMPDDRYSVTLIGLLCTGG
jgi:UDP:flavonoid glycosyltransferase YjiC (YdhE family)